MCNLYNPFIGGMVSDMTCSFMSLNGWCGGAGGMALFVVDLPSFKESHSSWLAV